ncbi:restriction endonuclease subunit S [Leptolyngbya sp. FACHB-261]|uniref:restriction endonuclease subunit S n=1 Tax=Leptolyngbya sp. FACHB-261 TaxID=2692806 RepID=UPI00168758CE|nr:restriction endonuclease subunit S [Leptolyngbya sp. FACHB-261]MBD2102314.1 restriction endonuclease subunit S [Leptolyngbya sp. FACHB-261]
MVQAGYLFKDLGESLTQGLSVSRYRDNGGESEFIVNVKDLEKLHIEHDLEQIKLNNTASIQRYRLRKNDVVIAIRGSLLKSSVVTEASEGSIAGQNVAIFRPKDLKQVNPGYIAVLMRSKWMEKLLYTPQKRSSTTLPSIRVSELRELKIPLPEINTQNQIVQLFLLFESYRELTLDALAARQELTEMSLFQLLDK